MKHVDKMTYLLLLGMLIGWGLGNIVVAYLSTME